MDEKNKNINNKTNAAEVNSESTTIAPVIEEIEEETEKKRDLSAIIPKFEEESNNANSLELISRDDELKGDGAVLLGTINSEGVTNVNNEAVMPEQIDIEQRKIEAQKRKSIGKKKKKKTSITAQKIQNSTALAALIIIIALAGFGYYIFN